MFNHSHRVLNATSVGDGIFVDLNGPLPTVSEGTLFHLSKNWTKREIEIHFFDQDLLHTIQNLLSENKPTEATSFDFRVIISIYDQLLAWTLDAHVLETPASIAGTGMILNGILFNMDIYAGVGLEIYKDSASQAFLTRIRQIAVDRGLDDLSQCFALGMLPEIIDDSYLTKLDAEIRTRALSGTLASLRELCGPIIASQRITLGISPSLLKELLLRRRYASFHYYLISTRTSIRQTTSFPGGVDDISYNPLYVSIRLGFPDAVRRFMNSDFSFRGRDYEHQGFRKLLCPIRGCTHYQRPVPDLPILTPLTAAAHWGRPDILRILLENSGESIEKGRLVDYFWTRGSRVYPEILQVLIQEQIAPERISALIERAKSREIILTENFNVPRRVTKHIPIWNNVYSNTLIGHIERGHHDELLRKLPLNFWVDTSLRKAIQGQDQEGLKQALRRFEQWYSRDTFLIVYYMIHFTELRDQDAWIFRDGPVYTLGHYTYIPEGLTRSLKQGRVWWLDETIVGELRDTLAELKRAWLPFHCLSSPIAASKPTKDIDNDDKEPNNCAADRILSMVLSNPASQARRSKRRKLGIKMVEILQEVCAATSSVLQNWPAHRAVDRLHFTDPVRLSVKFRSWKQVRIRADFLLRRLFKTNTKAPKTVGDVFNILLYSWAICKGGNVNPGVTPTE